MKNDRFGLLYFFVQILIFYVISDRFSNDFSY